jgi:hypothetical protein
MVYLPMQKTSTFAVIMIMAVAAMAGILGIGATTTSTIMALDVDDLLERFGHNN